MNRVSLLSAAIRRASFMGAAATALVAGAPLLYSRAVAAEITTVTATQATATTTESEQVQDLMSVPLQTSVTLASEPAFSMAIDESAMGGDDLIVDNDTAVSDGVVLDGEVGDITFNNTGDISGGIDVNTGKFRLEDSSIVFDETYETGRYVSDIAYDPDQGGWISLNKAKRYTTFHFDFHDANSNDATIRIQNDGTVRFDGERGINAKNESGSLIDITNTGDVISEGGTDDAVGIFADTTNQAMPFNRELIDSVVIPGTYEYTYAPDWQGNPTVRALHKVIEQGYQHYTYQDSGLWEDRGDIVIRNSGTIDLGADTRDTTGILTASPGKTTIDNSGDITVGYGRFAKGIQSYVQGETTVYNSGSIDFKNGGTGIDVRVDRGVGTLAEFYNGGDMLIVNTGDITGGVTREEFLAKDAEYIYNNSDWNGSPEIDATGMFGYSFGSNGRGNSSSFKWRHDLIVDTYERYGLELPTEGPLFEALERNKLYSEGVEFYETTLINAGNITLGDGAVGVKGASLYGQLNLINTGTISVGDGATDIENDQGSDFSAGMSSHGHYGSMHSVYADIYMLNEAGGIITTGDDAIGMAGYIQAGSLEMVNRGDINVGDGLAWEQVYEGWNGTSYQTYFAPSYGMRAQQPTYALYFTQTMTAYNGGNITTGDMSHGIAVSRMTRAVDYYPEEYDANAFNTGSVTTGNNSTGISIHSISDALVVNTGDISIGSRDDAQFQAISEQSFPNTGALNQGIRVRSQYASYVINDGAVTTGDGTAGVYSRVNRVDGQTSVLLNGENGSITTGDASTGVFMMGGGYAALENAGSITVGDNSIGVDSRFFGFADHNDQYSPLSTGYGGASIVNSGDIVAGNDSIGVSMSGTYQQGFACPYDPYGWSSCDDSVFQDTQLIGVSSLVNRGNIVVGDGSTAVEMSGIGNIYDGYMLPQLVNYGQISAGDNGIAIKINTADMLAFSGDKVVYGFSSGNDWLGDDGFGRGRYEPYNDLPPASEIAIDSTVVNYGTIDGHVLFGAGNDTLINARNETQVGTIVMRDNVIDFDAGSYGAGTYNFLANSGLITVSGDTNLINAVSGIYNGGEIRGDAGAVLSIEGNAGLGVSVGNYGTISSGLVFGDGDDLLVNSSYGGSPGTVIMNGSTIDFGGGNNAFYNLGGIITIESGDNRIAGASVLMAGGLIDAVNGQANSSLTIDGDVFGDFVLAVDIDNGGADKLTINGDVGAGSAIGVVINPAEQMSGHIGFGQLIKIDGENGAGDVELLGVSGDYADTLLDAKIHMREGGMVTVSGIFGMGHLSTATSAATTMLQNYWMQSVSSFDQRNSRWLAGSREGGISVWGGGYHNEGAIKPENALQNTHFNQLMSRTQFGLSYTTSIGDAIVAIGPNFSHGQGRASMDANTATATADALAYGINASVAYNNFYLDTAWQRADMSFNLSAPNSAMPTDAQTDGSSTGFNLEAGYRYTFESGVGLSPQLQYSTVEADLDDFTSTSGLYQHTEVGGKTSRARAGVSLFKTFTSPNGHLTPLVNLSYVNATDGDSHLKANGVSFENSTAGAGYDLGLGLSGRYRDWDIGVRLGASEAETTGINLSTNVNVRYRW